MATKKATKSTPTKHTNFTAHTGEVLINALDTDLFKLQSKYGVEFNEFYKAVRVAMERKLYQYMNDKPEDYI